MSKKVYNLVVGCICVASTLAQVLVAYFEPEKMVAIIAAIGIAEGAAVQICDLFMNKKISKKFGFTK